MRGSSINAQEFTIQNQQLSFPPVLALSGGMVNSSDGLVIQLILDNNDLNIIKEDTRIGTSTSNTYLSMTANAVNDTSDNMVAPIGSNFAIPARNVVDDTSPPQLLGFDLLTVGTGLETNSLLFRKCQRFFSE